MSDRGEGPCPTAEQKEGVKEIKSRVYSGEVSPEIDFLGTEGTLGERNSRTGRNRIS